MLTFLGKRQPLTFFQTQFVKCRHFQRNVDLEGPFRREFTYKMIKMLTILGEIMNSTDVND